MNPKQLTPLTEKVKKRRYLVLDIETKDGDSQRAGFTRPFLAGFYDGDRYYEFRGPDCLTMLTRAILRPQYEGWFVYAHYGGGFDYLHLLPVLKEEALSHGLGFEVVPVSSTIQAIYMDKIKGKRRGWVFLDSFKLIPLGLDKAAKSFGLQGKVPHDLDMHEDDARWSTYLEADCRQAFGVLERFHALVETQLRGEVGITAASTAMKTFRRGYLSAPINVEPETHELARAAYYGGRVECFAKHGEGLWYYDINSSYPYAMKQSVPTELTWSGKGTPPNRVLEECLGVCEVTLSMPYSTQPCLPYRHNGKLVFPYGTLRGAWTSIELSYAREHQGAVIHEWHQSHWYNSRRIMREYVDTLYSFRDKSKADYDEGLALTAKLLMNSLYGKFGQKTERERIMLLSPGETPPEGAEPANSDPDCLVWYITEESSPSYVIPQIAAFVTARARLTLHNAMRKIPARYSVYYCDTDSIVSNCPPDRFPDIGTELGQWKLEGGPFEGWFIQPKLYKLRNHTTGETKVAMKGYRGASGDLFDRIVSGETLVRQELEKLGALAKAGFNRGPLMRTVKKQMRSSDTKRNWPSGANHSTPLFIGDL